MNIQDESDICLKKFMARAEEKKVDISNLPSIEITKFCRMIAMYCESEGKVSESFTTAMNACTEKIKSVEGMEEILEEFNECPDD